MEQLHKIILATLKEDKSFEYFVLEALVMKEVFDMNSCGDEGRFKTQNDSVAIINKC